MVSNYTWCIHIAELPNPVRTIIGVSTSIAAFIGRAKRGPTDRAEAIHNFGHYTRVYWELQKDSKMSYAVYQYFLNGGQDAVIIRAVPADAAHATFSMALPLQD